MRNLNKSIVEKAAKLVLFFGVIFSVLFCVTWQSIHLYLLHRKIDELRIRKNELEKTLYLRSIDLSSLKSSERIRRIAEEQLAMTPICYADVKLIIY